MWAKSPTTLLIYHVCRSLCRHVRLSACIVKVFFKFSWRQQRRLLQRQWIHEYNRGTDLKKKKTTKRDFVTNILVFLMNNFIAINRKEVKFLFSLTIGLNKIVQQENNSILDDFFFLSVSRRQQREQQRRKQRKTALSTYIR